MVVGSERAVAVMAFMAVLREADAGDSAQAQIPPRARISHDGAGSLSPPFDWVGEVFMRFCR
ncbi:hypothetical protein GCM10027191_15850 [Novilysobacter erysipheiresistens]